LAQAQLVLARDFRCPSGQPPLTQMEQGEGDGLLDDIGGFDAELEGFFNNPTSGHTVNLQTGPMSFGNAQLEQGPLGEGASVKDGKGDSGSVGAAAAAAAVSAGLAASALMGGKFSTVATAALPTALQPVKDSTQRFLQNAQPWRDFLWPLSAPNASEGCSRLTSNVYSYQTNYAILFVAQLVLAILLQPSALFCIGLTVAVWVFFLKKNDDPDWHPVVGGMQLGPMQRWILLAGLTALVLVFVAGGTIFNAALMYVVLAFVHAMVHDTSVKSSLGSADLAVS